MNDDNADKFLRSTPPPEAVKADTGAPAVLGWEARFRLTKDALQALLKEAKSGWVASDDEKILLEDTFAVGEAGRVLLKVSKLPMPAALPTGADPRDLGKDGEPSAPRAPGETALDLEGLLDEFQRAVVHVSVATGKQAAGAQLEYVRIRSELPRRIQAALAATSGAQPAGRLRASDRPFVVACGFPKCEELGECQGHPPAPPEPQTLSEGGATHG